VTRYLSLAEVLKLHDSIISETGGSHGLRDLGLLESALGQPLPTFGGDDLYQKPRFSPSPPAHTPASNGRIGSNGIWFRTIRRGAS
jgi:hypothetical protein